MTAKHREEILKDLELSKSVLTDKEVCEMLDISLKTLYNKVSNGKMAGLYSISPINGKRFWYKTKVLGL